MEGMLEADRANALIHVVGADYCNEYYRDFNHLSGIGYHRLGERMADPIAQTLIGDRASCLAMRAAVRHGKYVDIDYDIPRPPLHLDFFTVSERSGTCAGFQFFAAQGIDESLETDTLGRAVEPEEIRVVAVTVLRGGERIRLELEREPEGAPIELLAYAWKGHGNTEDDSGELTEGDGGAIRRYAATIPRGNVRDSAGDSLRSSWDGGRLDNWAIHQIIQIRTEAGE
ncbi:MAG: hypothetical protein PUB69_00395 [Desulfovibrionaceae bacterium]|nr:hypothetical protein [Desulfovibrionaceae bacterium]